MDFALAVTCGFLQAHSYPAHGKVAQLAPTKDALLLEDCAGLAFATFLDRPCWLPRGVHSMLASYKKGALPGHAEKQRHGAEVAVVNPDVIRLNRFENRIGPSERS